MAVLVQMPGSTVCKGEGEGDGEDKGIDVSHGEGQMWIRAGVRVGSEAACTNPPMEAYQHARPGPALSTVNFRIFFT